MSTPVERRKRSCYPTEPVRESRQIRLSQKMT